jgi:threonine synthase
LELVKVGGLSVKELFPHQDGKLNVWRYRAALPIGKSSKPVTLSEGGTPLVPSGAIGKELRFANVFFKVEGQNPTGSFKDRGMTAAVTRAVETGARVLICASTGNTAASLAAYAARAQLKSAVVLPSGRVAGGKLAQAIAHGAQLITTRDGFDAALELIEKVVAESDSFYLMNSINPYRIEGQKTVAYEIYEQLGRKVPDFVVLPVGNAGNISAVWKGFRELRDWGIVDGVPRMVGVQAKGASPLADAYVAGRRKLKALKKPETVASAIRIGNPVSWKKALKAIKESKGMALSVSDSEIVQARRQLSSREGIFVENASAAPVAALRKLREGEHDAVVVCIATGHGLKEELPKGWGRRRPPLVRNVGELKRLLLSSPVRQD